MIKQLGLLLLTLALLCQGAVARVHIGADMAVALPTYEAQPTHVADCHQTTAVEPVATMPCHDDFGCDGECGQCQVISAAAAILPLLPLLPERFASAINGNDVYFSSITLFADSPPPSV